MCNSRLAAGLHRSGRGALRLGSAHLGSQRCRKIWALDPARQTTRRAVACRGAWIKNTNFLFARDNLMLPEQIHEISLHGCNPLNRLMFLDHLCTQSVLLWRVWLKFENNIQKYRNLELIPNSLNHSKCSWATRSAWGGEDTWDKWSEGNCESGSNGTRRQIRNSMTQKTTLKSAMFWALRKKLTASGGFNWQHFNRWGRTAVGILSPWTAGVDLYNQAVKKGFWVRISKYTIT